MIFDSILVIARPKKTGVGIHFGVQFPDGTVYDYTLSDGLRRLSLDRFADGEQFTVVRQIPWHLAHIVRARLDQLARNPRKYDLLTWNCETFAEWLTSGVPKSNQINGALVLAGIVVTLAFLTRA